VQKLSVLVCEAGYHRQFAGRVAAGGGTPVTQPSLSTTVRGHSCRRSPNKGSSNNDFLIGNDGVADMAMPLCLDGRSIAGSRI
jgi:hypothetical protein